MREVCSSAEGGDGDLPKVTKLGRGQLSWGSNPGGGEGGSPAAAQESWKVLSFLSLLCPLLNLGGRGMRGNAERTNFMGCQWGDKQALLRMHCNPHNSLRKVLLCLFYGFGN